MRSQITAPQSRTADVCNGCTAQEQTSTGKTHEKADEAKSASKKVAHFRFESEALGKCTTLPAIANPPT